MTSIILELLPSWHRYKTCRTSTQGVHVHKAVVWVLTFMFHSTMWTARCFDHQTQCLPSAPLITARVSETIGWPHAKTWPVFLLWFTSKLPVFLAVNATQTPQRGEVCVHKCACVCVCTGMRTFDLLLSRLSIQITWTGVPSRERLMCMHVSMHDT